MKRFHPPWLASLLLAVHLGAIAAPGDVFVQFMAQPEDTRSPGHVFMCVAMHTTTSIKEECWGFYPESMSDFLNGRGAVRVEPANDITRFSRVTESVKYKITEQKRKDAIATIHRYVGSTYSITAPNCGDMALDVAKSIGLRAPARSDFVRPVTFVQKLRSLNPGV